MNLLVRELTPSTLSWRALLDDGVRPKNLLVISNHRSVAPPPSNACLSNDSRLIAEALPLSLASIADFLRETFQWTESPSILAGFIHRETGGSKCFCADLSLIVAHLSVARL